MSLADWTTLYRWEWFRRDAWQPTFREQKRGRFGGSCACVAEIAAEFGPGARALDASCGFGLKTIVLAEMGVDVVGSDACAFAVEKARELARREGRAIDYFVSTWAELPERTPGRFHVIFNDALSWTTTREEFEASLAGFLRALSPGGVLAFMGAPEGAPASPEHQRKILDELMGRHPRFEIEWTHESGGARCTALAFRLRQGFGGQGRERGAEWMDEHHLFLVEEAGRTRLETATIRQPVLWHWPLLAEMFAAAGFASLHAREFPSRAADGGPVRLNIARREA